MLKKILSPKTCAACRLCCGFDRTDLWELPVLPAETVAEIHRLGKQPALVPAGTEQTFAAPHLEGEALFVCPMHCETGCTMGADKPFDCRIWPFRMMRDPEGALRITVASYCPGMQKYTDAQLRDFLADGLAAQILAYAKAHPAHVKAWAPEYRVIW